MANAGVPTPPSCSAQLAVKATTVAACEEGIPPEEMPQIFERFYKSDRSRGLDKNGVGLGLYIVHTVVRLHGGEVAVSSAPGEYTEFTFWIPEIIEKP